MANFHRIFGTKKFWRNTNLDFLKILKFLTKIVDFLRINEKSSANHFAIFLMQLFHWFEVLGMHKIGEKTFSWFCFSFDRNIRYFFFQKFWFIKFRFFIKIIKSDNFYDGLWTPLLRKHLQALGQSTSRISICYRPREMSHLFSSLYEKKEKWLSWGFKSFKLGKDVSKWPETFSKMTHLLWPSVSLKYRGSPLYHAVELPLDAF